jgi:hypothetical protein
MYMTTSIRQVGDVTIVDIRGRIVLGEESAALRELVCDLLSKVQSWGCQLHRQLRLGQSGRCFLERAEAGGRTEAAQPHE